jgi:DNA-binding transcriptional regulator YiaG
MALSFEEKKRRLEAGGWKMGNAEDFLGLSPAESEYIDVKLALSRAIKKIRSDRNLTQIQTAKILKTSQSRVVKMEKGDASVSADLLLRAVFSLGLTKEKLIRILS